MPGLESALSYWVHERPGEEGWRNVFRRAADAATSACDDEPVDRSPNNTLELLWVIPLHVTTYNLGRRSLCAF